MSKCYFGGWERLNLGSGAAASKTPMAWSGDSANLGEVMAFPGVVVGCSLLTDTDLPSGTAYEVEVYASTDGGISWMPTGVKATLAGGAGPGDRWAWNNTGSYHFITGETLRLYDQRTGLAGLLTGIESHGGLFVQFD